MGRRQFAKNSEDVRHFRLVARSQNDPRAETSGATPLVLEPYAPTGNIKRRGHTEAELLEVPQSLEDSLGKAMFGHEVPIDDGDCDLDLAEGDEVDDLDGDCYFPKDGYNYEKHLKKVSGGKGGGVTGVVLDVPKPREGAPVPVPKTTLCMQPAATTEEQEVLRSLEFAEEYEELDDGDLEGLLPGGSLAPPEVILFGPKAAEEADMPDLAFFAEMKRLQAEGLAWADEDGEDGEAQQAAAEGTANFDQFLVEEYANDDIGGCDEEQIEGTISLDNCEEMLDEFIQEKQEEAQRLFSINEPQKGIRDDVPRVIEETKALVEKYYLQTPEDEEETSSGEDSGDESRTWDCETVLSTLSNVSNRPGKIGRIKVVKKLGSTLKPVSENGKVEEGDKESGGEDDAVVDLPDVITTRPRGETPEERRARKASVKEMRRVCRRMKKESKETYKAEAQKLTGTQATGDIRAKARTFRL